MRVYLGGVSRPNIRKARSVAPSHVFGATWTPSDQRPNEMPFFVDNGVFTGDFDPDEWLDLLDSLAEYPYEPDFVVLPDEFDNAEKTLERHRQWAGEVLNRGLQPAAVLQPGLPVETQVQLADRIGAPFVFLGGADRWQAAVGAEVVACAHEHGLAAHIGNAGEEHGLAWAYKIGADSADTSTIIQSENWHYLERLEQVTKDHSKGGVLKKGKQSSLSEIA